MASYAAPMEEDAKHAYFMKQALRMVKSKAIESQILEYIELTTC